MVVFLFPPFSRSAEGYRWDGKLGVEISTDPISGDHGDPENVTVFRRSRGGKLPLPPLFFF